MYQLLPRSRMQVSTKLKRIKPHESVLKRTKSDSAEVRCVTIASAL